MGSFQKGTYESTCTLPEALNVLSIFGHSDLPLVLGLVCGEESLFSVASDKFASDIPPLQNFKKPNNDAGTKCSIAW